MGGWDDYDDDDFEELFSEEEVDEGEAGEDIPVVGIDSELASTQSRRGAQPTPQRVRRGTFDLDDVGLDLDDGGTGTADTESAPWLKPKKAEPPAQAPPKATDAAPPAPAVVAREDRQAAAPTATPPPQGSPIRRDELEDLGDAAPRYQPQPPKGPPPAKRVGRTPGRTPKRRSGIPRVEPTRVVDPLPPRSAAAADDVLSPAKAPARSLSRSPTRDPAKASGRQPFGRPDTIKEKKFRSKEQEAEGDAVVDAFAASHPYTKPTPQTERRVQSAASKKVNKLRNKLAECERELAAALQEVKTLKGQIRRQDKALDKFTKGEADLPKVLARKDDEIRALEEFNRRDREKLTEVIATVKMRGKQVEKLTEQNRALQNVVNTKGLKARKTLAAQVEALMAEVSHKDTEIARLDKLVHQAKKLRHRQKVAANKESATVEQTVALRREIEQLRDALERERRVNRAGRHGGKATAHHFLSPQATVSASTSPIPTTVGVDTPAPRGDDLAVFLTQTSPGPRSTLERDVAALSPASQFNRTRSVSPAMAAAAIAAGSTTTSPSARPAPAVSPSITAASPPPATSPASSAVSPTAAAAALDQARIAQVQRLQAEAAAAAAAAEVAAAAAQAEQARIQQEEEAARQREAAEAEARRKAEAEEAARRAEDERKVMEAEVRAQKEMEEALAAVKAEEARKAELLRKLAALDSGKSDDFAAKPAPETAAPAEKPADELPFATAEPDDGVPSWLKKPGDTVSSKASPLTQRKVDALKFGGTPTGSASSRRSRRELPQASRESENLHRGLPANGALTGVFDTESRASSGRSNRSLTIKLGAEKKEVIPSIAPSTLTAPAPPASAAPPLLVEHAKAADAGALPAIGTGASGGPANGMPRSSGMAARNRSGRLGGPTPGGAAPGFRGPRRGGRGARGGKKGGGMPWDKPKLGGVGGAAPSVPVADVIDDVEDVETLAI
mmetsp:Transcript_31223/g.81858  ORF Transcript_31223/g.81858 Transcript_31223/m.81858 type:complete len:961 (-) Transcript_31223:106-2988(-)|eukprot:CAMPEP_0182922464 /NCGR_PEP_ID=MMETSP0105_2-20130417/4814_1 /TAXON_ID=81532 ORGANISM="Acanthoeca-like sp., Strain 10tr" /NCGR_SAMPLE_ID=MMETSP0105_2 /ASSEMBLY_ACC=CAM_ASM_000205 /LENGTH=960 /DNA_ID=CAMNT_0025060081 /DNA_START=262 /DNA_END=3144 /DNA_ORIENTATION=+